MYKSQFESLVEAVKQAGAIGIDMQNSANIHRKNDGTVVTDADRKIEIFLRNKISELYPKDAILGEEQGYNTGTSARTWILDPIDGTADYTSQLPTWAISIGLFEGATPCGGICYLPLMQRLYIAVDGESFCNGIKLDIKNKAIQPSNFISLNAGTFTYFNCLVETRCFTSPSAINSCLVADGSSIGSFTLKSSIWDLAVSVPVLLNAGGSFEYLSGKTFDLSELFIGKEMQEPILGGTTEFIKTARSWFQKREN